MQARYGLAVRLAFSLMVVSVVGCSSQQADSRGSDFEPAAGRAADRHCRYAMTFADAGRCLAAGEQLAHCSGALQREARAKAELLCPPGNQPPPPVEPAPEPSPVEPRVPVDPQVPEPPRPQPPEPPPPRPSPSARPAPVPPPFVIPSAIPPVLPIPGLPPPAQPLDERD